jgi:hypothetical protein
MWVYNIKIDLRERERERENWDGKNSTDVTENRHKRRALVNKLMDL